MSGVLTDYGYTSIQAQDPEDALKACRTHSGPIHLVLTDVVMPEMYGPELAAAVTSLRPEIKTLYMSGYAEGTITHRGALEAGTSLLTKPFAPKALLQAVRKRLDDHGEMSG